MSLRLVPVRQRVARDFVAKHHRHNRAPRGGLYAIGAKVGQVLVGVVIVGRPVARALDDGLTVEVLRCCTDGTRNAPSFLYGAAKRAAQALGYRRCVTYTLQVEPGASLRAAGWQQAAMLRARKGWDAPSRPREVGTVDGQAKIRWEVAL